MKLKSISILTLAAVMGFVANANAGTAFDMYAGAVVGTGGITVFANDDSNTDTAISYGAVFGVDIPLVRVEAEYNYLNDTDFTANLAMLNAYFKMPSIAIKPYLGVGVGTTFDGKVENEFSSIDTGSSAAYQGMLGLTFDLPAVPFDFDIEGRALYVPNIFEIGDVKPDVFHYDLRLKIRFLF